MDKEELAARAQAPSSVDTDIMTGFHETLSILRQSVSISNGDIRRSRCCSSAAGGLRMVCVGLVREYTTEAGRLAALGAGAKVVGTYSYDLSGSELREIELHAPDIVLLTGGTDGGNQSTITNNAKALSGSSSAIMNIIVAGNKSAADDIERIFSGSGKNVIFAGNVMPEFGKLELDSVNEKIRELYISRITEAKGISRVREIVDEALVPTPSAVLMGAHTLSAGTSCEPGFGELMIVDPGGATTDVYSAAHGTPSSAGVSYIGLPEPYLKRTVEGDLGLYHNLYWLASLAAENRIFLRSGETAEKAAELLLNYSVQPADSGAAHDLLQLSRLAVKISVQRHSGTLSLHYTPGGDRWVQKGKDLRGIKMIIGTGGPLVFSQDPGYVLSGAAQCGDESGILKPLMPELFLDSRYILFAIGLMSESEPDSAIRIFKKYMTKLQK